MNLVCTGGRNYNEANFVWSLLSELLPQRIFVGDATGADELVRRWAQETGTPFTFFEADWKTHGKAAGPIRNRIMLEAGRAQGAILLAFPGGIGTDNCVKQAKRLEMMVLRASGGKIELDRREKS